MKSGCQKLLFIPLIAVFGCGEFDGPASAALDILTAPYDLTVQIVGSTALESANAGQDPPTTEQMPPIVMQELIGEIINEAIGTSSHDKNGRTIIVVDSIMTSDLELLASQLDSLPGGLPNDATVTIVAIEAIDTVAVNGDNPRSGVQLAVNSLD